MSKLRTDEKSDFIVSIFLISVKRVQADFFSPSRNNWEHNEGERLLLVLLKSMEDFLRQGYV